MSVLCTIIIIRKLERRHYVRLVKRLSRFIIKSVLSHVGLTAPAASTVIEVPGYCFVGDRRLKNKYDRLNVILYMAHYRT